MPSILITRPRATAKVLAQELEQLGYQAVIEPLLEIKPLSSSRPAGAFDDVMITSANALAALDQRREEITDLFTLPCFCVGTRTAGKASSFGFQQVQNMDGDGAELARFVAKSLVKKSKILHIAGSDIDNKAQQELEKQGHQTSVWPVYEAVPVKSLTAAAAGKIKAKQIDAILVFSPRTAETLAKLLKQHALEACCPQLAAICLSPAVAAALKPFSWRRLAAASAPAEQDVIALLQEVCPP